MTLLWWGALLGLAAGLGMLLVRSRVLAIRRPQLGARVLPYLRDLPQFADVRGASATPAVGGPLGPLLGAGAGWVERLLGGTASVRRRLERAGLDLTVHEFRVQQVVWGSSGSPPPRRGECCSRGAETAAPAGRCCCARSGSRSA